MDRSHESSGEKWGLAGDGGGCDSWKRRNSLEQLLVKLAGLVGGITLKKRVDGDEQQVLRIEADAYISCAAERFEEESTDHQEDDGERYLSADEHAARDRAEGAACGSGRASRHHRAPSISDRHECGRETEKQNGNGRHNRDTDECAQVEAEVRTFGSLTHRHEQLESADAAIGEQSSGGAAECRRARCFR